MAQRNLRATSDVDLPRWGPSTVKSAPAASSVGSPTPGAARKQRHSEQKERARSQSVARKSYLTMDKKQLAKKCKQQKVLATGTKGEMVERLMAQTQKVASPKTKSAKTWKSQPKMRHANTVTITADCGLKVRSPATKKSMSKNKKKQQSTLKDPRQNMKKQESRRYDQGNMFRIPGMSALDLFMNEAAANTEARKLESGKDCLSPSPGSDDSVDSGSGSENRDDEQSTILSTQPRMKHAKSAMNNKTAKKKRPKVSKSAKRQSVSVSSSSKESKKSKKKKSTKSTTSKKKKMPTGQPKFKHANTATISRKGKGKDKKVKKGTRVRAASGSWKSEHHSKSKSSTLKDPRSQMKKKVSRRYDEAIGLKAKGMSTLNMMWDDIDAKKAKEAEKKEEAPKEEPHLVHANTIGANMRFTEKAKVIGANEAKNEFVEVVDDDEEEYSTDEDFDDEEIPSAMSEQLLSINYTEDEIVKAVSEVTNKNDINDVVEQIEQMRQSDGTTATSLSFESSISPVYRRPKDDPSPSPSMR